MLLFVSFTSVSFASDGPETTKECVIDNIDGMEPLMVVNEFNVLFDEAEEAFDNEYKLRLKQRAEKFREAFNVEFKETIDNLINIREVEKIDYGVSNLAFSITDKTETTRTCYKFTDKSNMIRKLSDC